MTTRLDVLNSCLGSIGENPTTNADSNHPSVIAARTVLDRVTKALQMRGWWFNKEYNLTLSPNGDGEVVLPSNTLKCDPVRESVNYIKRGNKLYDPVNHTFVLSTAVEVNITVQLNIEDCPESMGDWIMKQTTYEFYRNDDGDSDKTQDLKTEARLAEVEVKKENLAASDVNSQNRPVSLLMMQRIKGPLGTIGGGTNPTIPGG